MIGWCYCTLLQGSVGLPQLFSLWFGKGPRCRQVVAVYISCNLHVLLWKWTTVTTTEYLRTGNGVYAYRSKLLEPMRPRKQRNTAIQLHYVEKSSRPGVLRNTPPVLLSCRQRTWGDCSVRETTNDSSLVKPEKGGREWESKFIASHLVISPLSALYRIFSYLTLHLTGSYSWRTNYKFVNTHIVQLFYFKRVVPKELIMLHLSLLHVENKPSSLKRNSIQYTK